MEIETQAVCVAVDAHVSPEEFRSKFRFGDHEPGYFCVRGRSFIMDPERGLVPEGPKFLETVREILRGTTDYVGWGLGLTAFQLSHRTQFFKRNQIGPFDSGLRNGSEQAMFALRKMKRNLVYQEITEAQMPTEFLKTEAYERLALRNDPRNLRQAIRTSTTCIEIAMPDIETAIRASDAMRDHVQSLAVGASAHRGQFWEALKNITGRRPVPEQYGNFQGFYESATTEGFAHDPRQSPHVMNISPTGKLRLDFFGSTNRADLIISWVREVFRILNAVLPP
ncbi:MAG: hypothetical protein WCJ29_02300 [bacterium]